MHEVVRLYREAERCLREFRLNDPWYIKPIERDGRGWGATEASAARYAIGSTSGRQDPELPDRRADDMECRPRDRPGDRGPIEEALIGTPIADPRDPVEVGHVAAPIDSCLVCTVHAHERRTGEELARFRTA